MADRPQSIPTPPPSWEEQPVFRELFLAHLPPSYRSPFAAVGALLYAGMLAEDEAVFQPAPHLLAVAADLDSAALFLHSLVADGPLHGVRHPTADWRDRLQELAVEVRASIEEGGGE